MPSDVRRSDAPDERARLARAQAALVDALTRGAPPPPGFDAGRVALAARALSSKRARGIARACPAAARALGSEFERAVADYAATCPAPAAGGPVEDAEAFLRWRARAADLPDALRRELLRLRLRRGWPVRATRLTESGSLLLGARLGRVSRLIELPLRRTRRMSARLESGSEPG
jgi:hypothetical protein